MRKFAAIPPDEAESIKASARPGRPGVTQLYNGVTLALESPGEVYHVPYATSADVGTSYARVRRHGMKLRVKQQAHDGVPGLMVWTEHLEG